MLTQPPAQLKILVMPMQVYESLGLCTLVSADFFQLELVYTVELVAATNLVECSIHYCQLLYL